MKGTGSRTKPSLPTQLPHPTSAQSLDTQPIAHHDNAEDDAPIKDQQKPVGNETSYELEEREPVDSDLSDDPDIQNPADRGKGDDLEKQKSQFSEGKGEALEDQTEAPAEDPNLVTWSGPDDRENPKNWSLGRKWAATFVVSSFTFISPVSSSMIAPAIGTLAKDFHVASDAEAQMMLSIFVLSYGFGPLLLGPMSEVFGRVRVLQLSNLFYLVWNLGCGFARNKEEMIVFRLLAGIGGSAPMAVGGGVLGDCWHAEQRGKAIGIYSLAPLLGPALGPLVGAWIAEKTTWRWVFWSTSITAVLVQISGLFFLQETFPPILLKRKADRLRKETGNEKLYTEFESDETLGKILRVAAVRAFRMLATQPIIQVIAVYLAYLFGMFYLILSTFPTVWQGVYQESVGIAGLNYLSLGLGFFLGAQTAGQVVDRIYRRLKLQNNHTGRPEFRIPLTFVGSCLIPIGLFWYGWSVEAKTHWIVPNVGITIFATGAMICMQCMQTYIIDSYTLYAASGLAAGMTLRSLAGFGFPLFAPNMYDALGYGWGNSVVAFAGVVIGLPAPFLFWFYGERLRNMSNFAK